jgi:hypothetical protein
LFVGRKAKGGAGGTGNGGAQAGENVSKNATSHPKVNTFGNRINVEIFNFSEDSTKGL